MNGRFLVMDVSCCSKSVVGETLARVIGVRFIDGHELHPMANVANKAAGLSPNDVNRAPWLERIRGTLRHNGTVVACSALQRGYRDTIVDAADAPVTYQFLNGRPETLRARMTRLQCHFMSQALHDSQLATLEAPGPHESFVMSGIETAPTAIVATCFVGLMEKTA